MHVCKTPQNVIHLFQVKRHKTSTKKGPAQLALKPVEYFWLLSLKNILVCNNIVAERLFCNTQGGWLKDLGQWTEHAWREAGLTGSVSFNLMRSSATTKVRFTKQTCSADNF